ncbi:hypothetical protein [Nocardia sp. NPDC020380]|uniref:hypothetical protein n=1 Tax=Nocardia sp. NPDC020380 TaxID=3364309 RepID=UPI00379E6E78
MVPLLLALTGCGSSGGDGNSSKSSSYAQAKLCSEFADFLRSDLALDIDDSTEVHSDKPVGKGTSCPMNSTSTGLVGTLSMLRTGTASGDPSNDLGYVSQKGFDEKVWLAPDNRFRVQVGPWLGTMEFYHQGDLSNDKTKQSIQFLIRTTHEVNN